MLYPKWQHGNRGNGLGPAPGCSSRELRGLGQATPCLPGGSPVERPGPLVSPGEAGNNRAPSRVTRGHPQGACKAGPSRPSSRQESREGAPRLPDDGSRAQTRPSSGAAKAPPSRLGRRAGDSVTGGRAGPSPPEHRRVIGVAHPPPAPTRGRASSRLPPRHRCDFVTCVFLLSVRSQHGADGPEGPPRRSVTASSYSAHGAHGSSP